MINSFDYVLESNKYSTIIKAEIGIAETMRYVAIFSTVKLLRAFKHQENWAEQLGRVMIVD